jgi:hypothetical protein
MYFFIFVLLIYILAKIFSKRFRQLNIDNINFFKLNIDEDHVIKEE